MELYDYCDIYVSMCMSVNLQCSSSKCFLSSIDQVQEAILVHLLSDIKKKVNLCYIFTEMYFDMGMISI